MSVVDLAVIVCFVEDVEFSGLGIVSDSSRARTLDSDRLIKSFLWMCRFRSRIPALLGPMFGRGFELPFLRVVVGRVAGYRRDHDRLDCQQLGIRFGETADSTEYASPVGQQGDQGTRGDVAIDGRSCRGDSTRTGSLAACGFFRYCRSSGTSGREQGEADDDSGNDDGRAQCGNRFGPVTLNRTTETDQALVMIGDGTGN